MSSIAAKKREEIMNSTSNMTAVKAEDVVHLQNATAARDMSLNNRVASSHAANSARAAAAAEGFVPPQVRHREEDILHQSLMEEAYYQSSEFLYLSVDLRVVQWRYILTSYCFSDNVT